MDAVTVSRRIDASPDEVRNAMADVGPFMEAAGFDQVTVDADELRVENQVGVKTIALHLALVDREGAALAYEQIDGIFEEMWTAYEVTESDGGTDVTATTEFALDVPLVGDVLDSTLIKRQRRRELTAQFDWLESVTETA